MKSLLLFGGATALLRHSSMESTHISAINNQLTKVKKTSNISPVQRVIALLKQMETDLQAESDKDQKLYEEMQCWCTTNIDEKTQAIANAEARELQLQSVIEESAANSARLDAEIKHHEKELKKAQESLRQARTIFEKTQGTGREEEKDMMLAITNLENAIRVLSRHSESFLQKSPETLSAVISTLVSASKGVSKKLQSQVNSLNLKDTANLLPLGVAKHILMQKDYIDAKATHLEGYNTQGSQILGVLKNMLDEFKSNLSTQQKEAIEAEKNYKNLKKTAGAFIDKSETSLAQMRKEKGESNKLLADSKEDFTATREQRSSDIEFLSNVKTTCRSTDHDWKKRTETRAEEIAAVGDALKILTQDEVEEEEAEQNEVSFLEFSVRRNKAMAIMQHAIRELSSDDLVAAWNGRFSQSPRVMLSQVTSSMKDFSKVQAVMDKMIKELNKQMKEEVEHKDFCVAEFVDNKTSTFDLSETKKDQKQLIEQLQSEIEVLADEIKTSKDEIAQTEIEIKKSGEIREEENKDFQTSVTEQRAAQEILTKVLDRLQKFYKKNKQNKVNNEGDNTTLIQQEPPVKFGEYKKSKGSSPVLSLIDKIIEDSIKVEKDSIQAESDAQSEYEKFVFQCNESIDTLTNLIHTKEEKSAEATSQKENTQTELASTEGILAQLAEYKEQLHSQCDFVLKNFDIRQQARRQEIEAIQEAKAILSGAK